MNFKMNDSYIRSRLISLRERRDQNARIGCALVAARLQREIDRLEKQLVETEREVDV